MRNVEEEAENLDQNHNQLPKRVKKQSEKSIEEPKKKPERPELVFSKFPVKLNRNNPGLCGSDFVKNSIVPKAAIGAVGDSSGVTVVNTDRKETPDTANGEQLLQSQQINGIRSEEDLLTQLEYLLEIRAENHLDLFKDPDVDQLLQATPPEIIDRILTTYGDLPAWLQSKYEKFRLIHGEILEVSASI